MTEIVVIEAIGIEETVKGMTEKGMTEKEMIVNGMTVKEMIGINGGWIETEIHIETIEIAEIGIDQIVRIAQTVQIDQKGDVSLLSK